MDATFKNWIRASGHEEVRNEKEAEVFSKVIQETLEVWYQSRGHEDQIDE
jgi:hypothetical protein